MIFFEDKIFKILSCKFCFWKMDLKIFIEKTFLHAIQNIDCEEFENIYIKSKRLPYFILDQNVLYLEMMLVRGLDPNLKSQNKKPLMFEASPEHLKLLLEYGGNPKINWGKISLVDYIIKKETGQTLIEKINLLKACGVKVKSLSTGKNPYRKKDTYIDYNKDVFRKMFQDETVYKYEKLEDGNYDFVKYEGKFNKEAYDSFILYRKKFEIIKQ
jgi:hypothetical protein